VHPVAQRLPAYTSQIAQVCSTLRRIASR
jgi:hypothetical protein